MLLLSRSPSPSLPFSLSFFAVVLLVFSRLPLSAELKRKIPSAISFARREQGGRSSGGRFRSFFSSEIRLSQHYYSVARYSEDPSARRRRERLSFGRKITRSRCVLYAKRARTVVGEKSLSRLQLDVQRSPPPVRSSLPRLPRAPCVYSRADFSMTTRDLTNPKIKLIAVALELSKLAA